MWERLEFRRLREPERPPLRGGARGSNPLHADFIAVVPVLVSGGRLLNVTSQVRFLPPQLHAPLAERPEAPVFHTGQAGSIPAGHFVFAHSGIGQRQAAWL